jgi:glycosyltransferase involved in cell wall biosynthesis
MDELPISKKRICWITPDYFLAVDAYIVPKLANDYEIEWILINTRNTKRTSDGLVFHTFKPKEFNLKYRQRDPRIILQYIRLLIDIRRSGNDLIYLSFSGPPYFFPIFFLLINVNKVVYGIHNVSTPHGAASEHLMQIYHSYIFKRLKNFHVFSKYQLSVITKLLPKKKHYYAPLALKDLGSSKVTPPNDVIRFLFFGYIREYKRLDLLINSFQNLYISGINNIELDIVGDCDNWEYYQSMITVSQGIKTRIEVIPNKDIPDIISSCHYLVLPYQDGTQSGVLNFAYQYNKPVIASDIDSFKEFIVDGSTGFFFKSESQESLSSVMKDVILRHNTVYEDLKENISAFVKKEFSGGQIITKYKFFLDKCMNRDNNEKRG